MKIYRTHTIWQGVTLEVAQFKQTLHPDYRISQEEKTKYSDQTYCLKKRCEFLRDHHIDGKTLAKLLPARAKVKFPAVTMGKKVTAFYAENDKVVTDTSICVGSDDWLIAQDDPFRAAHLHLFYKYGMYAEEFGAIPKPSVYTLRSLPTITKPL